MAAQRSQFLAIVNHEVRNAAAGVVGWTERLSKLSNEDVDDRINQGISYAYEGAQQLHRLVVDLLDLSRIEARQLPLDMQNADLRALIREVAGSVGPSAERRGIELRVAGLDQRMIVFTDATRVRQILLNLLSNAIKFTKPGGQIDLGTDACEGGWNVIVRDTGPGIDPAVGDDVFEAYRSVANRSSKSGAGLGLAISRELARLLGGSLTYVDDGKPGACFALCLPSEAPSARRDQA